MCLIVFSVNEHPNYKLVMSANRDEFLERPTEHAHYWKEHQEILAGKDLRNGGTWLGINKNGNLAALTNYRDPKKINPQAPSRGNITKNFLLNHTEPTAYTNLLEKQGATFNGYNLLLRYASKMYHYSNVSKTLTELSKGTFGLSNALLNTSWPKVEEAKARLAQALSNDLIDLQQLTDMMQLHHIPEDDKLPSTGVPLEVERLLSPMYIKMKGYGTRCTTALTIDHENVLKFQETNYNEHFEVTDVKKFEFEVSS